MGNQAALSGLSGVPRGSLFGVEVAVTVCRVIFEVWVYGSFRRNEYKRVCGTAFGVPLRAFLFTKAEILTEYFSALCIFCMGGQYVGLQGFIP